MRPSKFMILIMKGSGQGLGYDSSPDSIATSWMFGYDHEWTPQVLCWPMNHGMELIPKFWFDPWMTTHGFGFDHIIDLIHGIDSLIAIMEWYDLIPSNCDEFQIPLEKRGGGGFWGGIKSQWKSTSNLHTLQAGFSKRLWSSSVAVQGVSWVKMGVTRTLSPKTWKTAKKPVRWAGHESCPMNPKITGPWTAQTLTSREGC